MAWKLKAEQLGLFVFQMTSPASQGNNAWIRKLAVPMFALALEGFGSGSSEHRRDLVPETQSCVRLLLGRSQGVHSTQARALDHGLVKVLVTEGRPGQRQGFVTPVLWPLEFPVPSSHCGVKPGPRSPRT